MGKMMRHHYNMSMVVRCKEEHDRGKPCHWRSCVLHHLSRHRVCISVCKEQAVRKAWVAWDAAWEKVGVATREALEVGMAERAVSEYCNCEAGTVR